MPWPKQAGATAFYGNPSVNNVSWQLHNLTRVQVPWLMFYGSSPVSKITIHVKCAASLERVLKRAWDEIGHDQKTAAQHGWSAFSGSYNYRPVRGRKVLSLHAYGAAIDFDAAHNPLGEPLNGKGFTPDDPLIKAFKAEGWRWGGDYKSRPDKMHIEAVSG